MTDKPYRVGTLQYLTLGALAQAPHMALTQGQLRDHFNRWYLKLQLSPVLKALLARGLVDFDDRLGVWCLTSQGGDVRCAKSRTTRERFLRLDYSDMAEMVDAS